MTGLEEASLLADIDISEVILSEEGSFNDLMWVSASDEPYRWKSKYNVSDSTSVLDMDFRAPTTPRPTSL